MRNHLSGRLTIAKRLALGFGMLLLLLVAAVALGLNRLGAVDAMVEHVVTHDWDNTVLANRVVDLMNAQTRDTFLLFHVPDQTPVRQRIAQRVEGITALLDELDAKIERAHSRVLLDELRQRRTVYVESFSTVAQLLEADRHDEASRRMVVETVPALDALLASIDDMIALQGRILMETGRASLKTFESARQVLMVFLAAAVLAALMLSIWIIRAVVRPLGGEPEDARAVVERIAGGDLSGAIPLRPGDTHSLLAAMQIMQRNLRTLIDARTQAEEALRTSQQRFQGLIETLRDWVWEVDDQWRYTYVGPQITEILGYEPEELLGKTPFELMPPEESLRVRARVEATGSTQHPIVALENVNLHKNGYRVVLESSGRPYYDEQGGFCGYRGLDREITGRKEAEAARLAETLRLRDALIREVHHRIKNNLQTVVSLLRREAGKRPEAKVAIEAAIAQVQAVAVVHGLFGRVARHSVLLGEVLAAVVGSVSELTGVSIRQDEVVDQDDVLVRESETVAVALILNELVTNAVKHTASPSAMVTPRVTQLQEVARSRSRIRIANIGQLPVGFDFDAGRGLGTGLGLVRALTPTSGMSLCFRQLGPYVEVEVAFAPPILLALSTVSHDGIEERTKRPATDPLSACSRRVEPARRPRRGAANGSPT